jgi:hypothetical protein
MICLLMIHGNPGDSRMRLKMRPKFRLSVQPVDLAARPSINAWLTDEKGAGVAAAGRAHSTRALQRVDSHAAAEHDSAAALAAPECRVQADDSSAGSEWACSEAE